MITWFVDGQIGFLDFAYRLHAIAKDYELTLVSRRTLDEPEVIVPNATVVVLPVGGGLFDFIRYWIAAARYARSREVELVVLLGSQVAAVANVDLGAPQAVYWNEHPSHYLRRPRGPGRWLGALLEWLQYRGARQAAVVMPIGEAHRDDLVEHGCSPDRVALLPMGVADMFAARHPLAAPGRDPAEMRLVYAGAVHPNRGRDVMIDAVAAARQQGCNVRLTIIGVDPTQRTACAKRCADRGLTDEVRLLPRVPGERIPAYLEEADFGLCLWADMIYWRFNPPTKLFECLVAGLPVLVSDIRTHTAYVRDGEHGYVFAYDAASLASALCRAWAERPRWPAMRRAAADQGRTYRWSGIEPRFRATLAALRP